MGISLLKTPLFQQNEQTTFSVVTVFLSEFADDDSIRLVDEIKPSDDELNSSPPRSRPLCGVPVSTFWWVGCAERRGNASTYRAETTSERSTRTTKANRARADAWTPPRASRRTSVGGSARAARRI